MSIRRCRRSSRTRAGSLPDALLDGTGTRPTTASDCLALAGQHSEGSSATAWRSRGYIRGADRLTGRPARAFRRQGRGSCPRPAKTRVPNATIRKRPKHPFPPPDAPPAHPFIARSAVELGVSTAAGAMISTLGHRWARTQRALTCRHAPTFPETTL